MLSITPIKSQAPNFKADIIDAHVHRGTTGTLWKGEFFPTNQLDSFIKSPLEVTVNGKKQTDNVKKALVSSIDGLIPSQKLTKNGGMKFIKDEKNANMDVIKKSQQDPFYQVMLVCQPSATNGNAKVIRSLIKHHYNNIAGLKLHPGEMGLNANSTLYDDYLKAAEEFKLPCLIHSEVSINYVLGEENSKRHFADPEYIYELAKRHPNVPIVLGHTGLGGSIANQKAIGILEKSIKNNDAKLYAEISWMDFHKGKLNEEPKDIIDLIKRMKDLGALDRIMFGTDAPLGIYGELNFNRQGPKESYEDTVSTLKSAIKTEFGDEEGEEIINKIFYENADNLFFKNKPVQEKRKMPDKKQILAGVGGVAVLSAIVLLVKKLKK